jgi:hypothetical protein
LPPIEVARSTATATQTQAQYLGESDKCGGSGGAAIAASNEQVRCHSGSSLTNRGRALAATHRRQLLLSADYSVTRARRARTTFCCFIIIIIVVVVVVIGGGHCALALSLGGRVEQLIGPQQHVWLAGWLEQASRPADRSTCCCSTGELVGPN